jgi:hypothetical protein
MFLKNIGSPPNLLMLPTPLIMNNNTICVLTRVVIDLLFDILDLYSICSITLHN